MAKLVRLPVSPDADELARANAERTQRLFEWATTVLGDLGLAEAVKQAESLTELRGITLNVDDARIRLAIRDALYPASGDRQEHFKGLRDGRLVHDNPVLSMCVSNTTIRTDAAGNRARQTQVDAPN